MIFRLFGSPAHSTRILALPNAGLRVLRDTDRNENHETLTPSVVNPPQTLCAELSMRTKSGCFNPEATSASPTGAAAGV